MTTAIKERPILFSEPMVKAILDGDKLQTRRLVKPNGSKSFKAMLKKLCLKIGVLEAYKDYIYTCPYGQPGDRLWVRETMYVDSHLDLCYKVDNLPVTDNPEWEYKDSEYVGGIPSIHMPRWASRILLEITDIRVERVQGISEADAKAEGVLLTTTMKGRPLIEVGSKHSPLDYISLRKENENVNDYMARAWNFKAHFAALWDSINADRGFGWPINPWVWVIEFKNITDSKGV